MYRNCWYGKQAAIVNVYSKNGPQVWRADAVDEDKVTKDKCRPKQTTALSDVAVNALLRAQAHSSSRHIHPEQQTAGPRLQSRQSVESKRFEAYVKSLWIQNKALSRTLCLCWADFAFLHTETQSSKSRMNSIVVCSALFCSVPLHSAAPVSAASADLPLRPERAPQHPED